VREQESEPCTTQTIHIR